VTIPASTPAQMTVTRDRLLVKILRSPLGSLALIVIGVELAACIVAPMIASNPPGLVRISMVNAPPGGLYLLGGDGSGRDIWSRLVYGSRATLAGAAIVVAAAATIGVIAGLIAGYFGGLVDAVASWVSDALMSLPALVVLLALFPVLGSSIYAAMLVFGVMFSPAFFRLVRGLVRGVRNELYLDAARVSGLSDLRIIGRHVLLVIRAPVIIQIAIVSGIAIMIQSGLEFLGLGDPATPTWGSMLQDAFRNIYTAPTAILWPGLAITITVAALVLLGNVLRDGLQRTRRSVWKVRATATPGTVPPAAREVRAMAPDTLLDVDGLAVGYPSADGHLSVVNGVSFQVRKGEVLGLVGESGSGKTQTAFAILGLLSPGGRILGGSILFDGMELTSAGERGLRELRGQRIAYIPQEPMSNLDPAFRVGDQLTEPMRVLLGISAAEAERRALALLERVGIADPRRMFRSYPHEISGGMAQRVLIAGAVSANPALLIADEPTTALDVTVQAEVLDLLRSLQGEYGMSVLMVTHNLGVVADCCDRVAVMRAGEIVEVGDVETVFAAPQNPYTRTLLDSTLEDSVPPPYLAPSREATQ
jgi:peptide/nickel transport system permease protein